MQYIRKGIIGLALLGCVSCKHSPEGAGTNTATVEESARLNAFFDRSFDRMLDRSPMYAAILGIKKHPDQWDDISDSFAQVKNKIAQAELDSLKSYDYNKLNDDTKLSYKLYELDRKNQLEAFDYRFNNYPVNQEEGLQADMPTFLVNVHKIANRKDADDYVSRLNKVGKLFDQLITNIKLREAKGVIVPRFAFPKMLTACQNIITGAPFDDTAYRASPLWDDFKHKTDTLKGVSTATKDSLQKAASQALVTVVKPAYARLMSYLQDLQKKAPAQGGAWSMPDGDKFYQMCVRHTTTTNMSPEEVYQFGTQEVARIQGEIKEIMIKLNFKGSIQDFFRYMTDPKNKHSFYPNTEDGRQAYLKLATDYIGTMKTKLDELFLTKPKADIVVKAVEKFRETSAGTAFYEQPSLDGSRPGRFYVNLYDMTQSPIYQLEALAYHEGIPGHHMQISIAEELKNVPQFRKFTDYTAYVEGWGLYAERIPKEIGMYQDIYEDFGRLSMELMRSARCVVDPGLHNKHWTREQAIQYFKDNTAEPPIECEHAIERYIVWPGQATAYKVGMNKILELREKAKKELGDKFNIREFHDVVLTSGAVPLNILEDRVNTYIATKKKS